MRIHPLVLLVFISLAAGCQTCAGVGDFTVTRETEEAVVEGQSSPLNDVLPDAVVPQLAFDFSLQNELEKRDAKGAKAVRLTELTIETTDSSLEEGDEDNFDFLNSIRFFVESAEEGSELPRREIAAKDPVPEGQTVLEFDTDESIDLKPYVQEGVLLTTSGEGSVPPDDVSVVGIVTIKVETL